MANEDQNKEVQTLTNKVKDLETTASKLEKANAELTKSNTKLETTVSKLEQKNTKLTESNAELGKKAKASVKKGTVSVASVLENGHRRIGRRFTREAVVLIVGEDIDNNQLKSLKDDPSLVVIEG